MSAPSGLLLRLALREMRGGLKGFRIFLACLALGVAAIAAVGSVSGSVLSALDAKGRSLLSGDVELRLTHRPLAADERAYLAAHSRAISEVIRLRAMARAEGGGERTLVEMKAVDGLYPLYGVLERRPATPMADALAKRDGLWGALIDPKLAARLKVNVGDALKIGAARFQIRALIDSEPDRSNEGFQLGPTVMVSTAAMPETGLIRLGSLVRYHYRLALADGADLDAWKKDLEAQFPEAGWRLRDRENSAPGVRRFAQNMGSFLTLVGLTALAIGGVGVGNAVRGYLDGKTKTIATLKILGAPGGLIFQLYLLQIGLLAALGVAIGLALGAAAPVFLTQALAAYLPVMPDKIFYPGALAQAALYGFLITLIFACWPLARAREIPAARLFRNLVTPDRRWPRPPYLLLILAAIAALGALAVLFSNKAALALGFIAAAIAILAVLRGLGALIERAARRAPRLPHPGLRLAVANLHRPGAGTAAVVLSLGLGLTLFAALSAIEANLSRQIKSSIPEKAPAFFFVDIQKQEVDAFKTALAAVPGTEDIRLVPSLRGPISKVNGVPAEEVKPDPDVAWVLRGDRGLTYAAAIPEGNIVTQGDWWPQDYSGPPLVSLGEDAARGLGLSVGDTLSLDVLGREITARIANLRSIDWGTYGFNFVIVFAPGALEAAPHSYMATVKTDGAAAEAAAYRVITDQFPGVSVIRMKEVLSAIDALLSQIGGAVRITALVAILAGILVLTGAMAAGHQARVHDAVILKMLGATRRDILGAYVLEYLILGAATGLIALGLGLVAGYAVVTQVLDISWSTPWAPMILTVLAAVLLTAIFGLAATARALSVKANRLLAAA